MHILDHSGLHVLFCFYLSRKKIKLYQYNLVVVALI